MPRKQVGLDHVQRFKALKLYLSGNARKNDGTLQRPAPPVTLPALNIITLSEIEAKYGRLTRASGVRPEMASQV